MVRINKNAKGTGGTISSTNSSLLTKVERSSRWITSLVNLASSALRVFCRKTTWMTLGSGRYYYPSLAGLHHDIELCINRMRVCLTQHPPTQQQTARIPNLNCSSANPGNELMGFSLLNPNAALIFGGHGIQASWAGTKLELSTGICINIHILYIHTELDHPQRQKNYWNQTLDILCFSMIHTDILRTKKNTVDCVNTYILIMRSIIHP